jgi:hypothetical protein
MESEIIKLVTMDRLNTPIKSLDNKIGRRRRALAQEVSQGMSGDYFGEKVFAEVRTEDKNLARGTKEAISEFSDEYPKYGAILAGKIAEKRVKREKHLYFGLQEGEVLSHQDYMAVMDNLGISENKARILYPTLVSVSNDLESKKKSQERRVIVGKYEVKGE